MFPAICSKTILTIAWHDTRIWKLTTYGKRKKNVLNYNTDPEEKIEGMKNEIRMHYSLKF